MARNCSKVRAARTARLFSLIRPMNLILNWWGRRCCSRRDAKDKVGCSSGAETELLRAINYKRDFNMTTESKWENGKHGSIFCDGRIAGDRRRSQKCVSKWSQTIAQLSSICDRLRSYGNYVITAIKGSFIDITTIMRINIALFPRQKVEMRLRMR